MSAHVLVVDDDPEMCRTLAAGLRPLGYVIAWRTSADDAFDDVVAGHADLVVTDLRMKGMNGIERCERIVANRPDVPVIVMTAFGSVETAVATIRAGAADFLTKPLDAEELALAIERALAHKKLRDEVKHLRRAVELTRRLDDLVGEHATMTKLFGLVERLADSDATVLVTGESGTGKELVARALHRRSKRKDGPFVALSCAAIPESLVESELFGHEKGAFTDAKDKREGLFARAHGGTLLLDEVGELPLGAQTKLLRALEARAVRPVGGGAEVAFDARIVAATNRDLHTAVDEGRFRGDLLYRLDVVQLELPPLRARGADVLLLAQHFLTRFAQRAEKPQLTLSPAVAEKLLAYAWPGNVRELQNCVERAVALAQYERIMVEDLPPKIRDYRRSDVLVAASDPEELVAMEEVERRYALRVLEACGGNKNMAARILGWDRKTLYRRLERWGV